MVFQLEIHEALPGGFPAGRPAHPAPVRAAFLPAPPAGETRRNEIKALFRRPAPLRQEVILHLGVLLHDRDAFGRHFLVRPHGPQHHDSANHRRRQQQANHWPRFPAIRRLHRAVKPERRDEHGREQSHVRLLEEHEAHRHAGQRTPSPATISRRPVQQGDCRRGKGHGCELVGVPGIRQRQVVSGPECRQSAQDARGPGAAPTPQIHHQPE